METNFNSSVCTSIEQSHKLLSIGLKKDTADMHHWESEGKIYTYVGQMGDPNGIPAWSLDRLISLIKQGLKRYDGNPLISPLKSFALGTIVNCDNVYDAAIETLEYLIKHGYFDKEFIYGK